MRNLVLRDTLRVNKPLVFVPKSPFILKNKTSLIQLSIVLYHWSKY